MPTDITLSVGSFPVGFCWGGPQQYANALVQIMSAVLPGNLNTFNYGSNTPSADDNGKPWIKTFSNPAGAPDGLYIFFDGKWVRPHPIAPSSKFRQIYVGTNDSPGLWSDDGGDGGAPSGTVNDITGPMWEIDTAFNFKVPMGVGSGPGFDGDPATVLGLMQNLGAERVTIFQSTLGTHIHAVGKTAPADFDAKFIKGNVNISTTASYNLDGNNDGPPQDGTISNCDLVTGPPDNFVPGKSIQNLPPVVGVYFIKRTARIYYVAA